MSKIESHQDKQISKHKNLDVQYLLKQNRKLKMEIKQAKNMAQLHKKALLQISQGMQGQEIVKTLCSIINSSRGQQIKQKLRDQVMALQGQIMVLQKIVNQCHEDERQTYLLLVEQFKQLQQQNSRMDAKLNKFYQKIGQVDYLSGLVTKYKQIVQPSQIALAAKRQQDQLLDMLNLQRQQLKKIQEQKQKLLKINVHMKEQVQRKKQEVKNMTMMILTEDHFIEPTQNILQQLDQSNIKQNNNQSVIKSNQSVLHGQSLAQFRNNMSTINMSQANLNTTINFVKLQRQLIKEVDQENINNSSDSEQFDCPQLNILFPDKVQKIKTNKQEAKVPYLNMKKVRQLMMKRQQKMRKDAQAQGHNVNPTNKIIHLQTQLQITRKQLTSQMLKFKTMTQENKRMAQQICQLQNRNQLLIKSNQCIANNYRNVYTDYQICKSITNQVERLLGKKILNQKAVLDARQELSTFIYSNQNKTQNNMRNLVQNIFRDRVAYKRTLSP